MPAVNKIQISGHPVLKDFVWENIPQFAVITGVNGAGKTKFLESINASFQEIKTNIAATLTKQPSIDEFGYVPWRQDLGGFEQGYYHNMMNDLQNFKNRIASNQISARHDQNMWRIYSILKDVAGIDAKGKGEDYFEQGKFIDAFRDAWVYCQDLTFNKHISRLFINYIIREEEVILSGNKRSVLVNKDDIVKEIGVAPWELINQLFEQYGFKYQVNAPANSHESYHLKFILRDNPNVKVPFEALSSGEQMIVTLIFWSFNTRLATMKKFLMLDEPDAHLHPEMALMFKNIISDILVKKYGIQVFITTHSPTTLCWMDEDDIFLMDKEKGVLKSTKQEALSKLTSGLVFVHQAFKIILVEGDADQKFYQKVFDSLIYNKFINPQSRLVFKSVETPKANGGGKTNVIEVCRQWQKFSSSTEIAGLINGLVDMDKDANSDLPENVIPLSRYCFENYLSDPLLMFCLLVEEEDVEVLKYAQDIGYNRGHEYRFVKAEVGNEQNIVNFIMDKVQQHNPSMFNNADLADTNEVQFINGLKVNVPKKLFRESGKDFWLDLYRKTYAAKQGRINHHNLQDMMVKTQLIPKDLLAHLEGLV